jgi:hypothetical protein
MKPKRQMILRLLAEEEAKLASMTKPPYERKDAAAKGQ